MRRFRRKENGIPGTKVSLNPTSHLKEKFAHEKFCNAGSGPCSNQDSLPTQFLWVGSHVS